MDSIPLVIISGQVPTHAIGAGCVPGSGHGRHHASLREAQLPGKDVHDIAVTMKKAFYIARTGRPGPVVVDIPKDVQQHKAQFHYPGSSSLRSYNPVVKGHAGQIKKALQLTCSKPSARCLRGGGGSSAMLPWSSRNSCARSAIRAPIR